MNACKNKIILLVTLALILPIDGCRKNKEVFGRLDEDGRIASPVLEYLFPEKYKALPLLCVEKHKDEYRVWLTLEDWQKRTKPWLKANMTDTRGDTAYAISDFRVTDSHVEFGEKFKVRPLKIIWPSKHEYKLRRGEYGILHLKNIKAEWTKDSTGFELSMTVVVTNVAIDTKKLSGEFYFTGDDKVLISKLHPNISIGLSKQEVNDSGFVDADSFYLCDIDGKSDKEFNLKTEKISKEVFKKFRSFRLEHLAYGWQRDIEPPN